jgi:hypothetical protein
MRTVKGERSRSVRQTDKASRSSQRIIHRDEGAIEMVHAMGGRKSSSM